ncbi:MAG: peptide-methionine (R)-S-oxide reductase [Candidatus Levybacteria bacterium RIFCSPHIGHO2_02_FULL_37_13]|nr:MAG: peptide-methionine (R)-S-oxide reductase [Candidatus Levybacteria bacterium RIFCSPHIGHO2_02_FULL_37_13]OGH37779.1 MAG: peptide-methionine (R)-S-oxide reductase [Candidatus Levybacteria bacterium RIFCSPLOWO2_01_FULL_37_26]
MDDPRKLSDEYWKKKLTPQQYEVLRNKGTETPFTGKFYKNFESGMYECAACGNPLFSSETKFDSDCGWPSFDGTLEGNVEFKDDNSLGMQRTEVVCKNCGGHLGHVFDDTSRKAVFGDAGDPKETTGKRFCINSISLNFKPKKY